MSTMLQVRNVPDNVHRQLKARAALAGKSLSEFALGELRRALERPTREELIARVANLVRVELPYSAAQALADERHNR